LSEEGVAARDFERNYPELELDIVAVLEAYKPTIKES